MLNFEFFTKKYFLDGTVSSLLDLTAQAIAAKIPFEKVENFPLPIPEDLQLKITFWSFPESEEDIRLAPLSYLNC